MPIRLFHYTLSSVKREVEIWFACDYRQACDRGENMVQYAQPKNEKANLQIGSWSLEIRIEMNRTFLKRGQ